jgi:hypothetical protein
MHLIKYFGCPGRNTFCCLIFSQVSHFFFLRKAHFKELKYIRSTVVKKHYGQTFNPLLIPSVFSKILTVVDIRFAERCGFMRSCAIS